MGLWDVVKNVAISVRCFTGWHSGEWSHIPGKPQCFVEKTCPDCNQHLTTKKHEFSEWRRTDYMTCNSVRECEHCGSIEQNVIHDYEKIGKDENCRVIEKCQHCGNTILGGEDHEWLTIFDHEIKVDGKKKCKRCGKME